MYTAFSRTLSSMLSTSQISSLKLQPVPGIFWSKVLLFGPSTEGDLVMLAQFLPSYRIMPNQFLYNVVFLDPSYR